MFITIITFIIILGLLVFVHELGHFMVAKKSGMKVDEFGFGFPPRIFGLQKIENKWKIIWGHKPPLNPEETVYSINWIPLGGFVKIIGENNDHAEDPRSFINKGFWPRFLTLIAGVSMNIILAWIILTIGFMIHLRLPVDSLNNLPKNVKANNPFVMIADVQKNTPAFYGGLKIEDQILSINNQQIIDTDFLKKYLADHQGEKLNFVIKREGKILNLNVQLVPKATEQTEKPILGISMVNTLEVTYPWYAAFWQGAMAVYFGVINIFSGLWQLIIGHVSLENLGGPIKIAQLTGQAARSGFSDVIQLTAMLSINLAVLNILPLPALDGGRVLFLIIEKLRRKKNNQIVEQWVNTIGFLFLLLLIVAISFHDLISINFFHKITQIFSR